MVRKPDIQYLRGYTDGSSARALQFLPIAPKTKLPKPRRQKHYVLRLDPLAYAGIAVSLLMLVLMVVSCIQLSGIQKKTEAMSDYVDVLREENARLQDTYDKSFDLEDIRRKALAMGLVPVEEVTHIRVQVEHPLAEQEESAAYWAFLTDISE